MPKNIDLRTAVLKSGVKWYQIADAMGRQESSLSRMLRRELTSEQKKEILEIVETIKKERR